MTYDMRIRTGFGEYLGGRANYFSLTGNGMMRYIDVMFELGMMHDSDSPMKKEDWPKWDETLDEEEAELKYAIELEEKTIRHGTGLYGEQTIPYHKFHSNDRWIVTPDEIEAALEMYDNCSASHIEKIINWAGISPVDGWFEWIRFLHKAKDHAGFRVM